MLSAEVARMALVSVLLTGGAVVGYEALEEAYDAGAGAAQRVQLVQDEQLVRAARIGCAAEAGEAECATEAQLVERGWLLPEWSGRERVAVEPLELPVQLADQMKEAGQVQDAEPSLPSP